MSSQLKVLTFCLKVKGFLKETYNIVLHFHISLQVVNYFAVISRYRQYFGRPK